jgi:hypothetical protein
MGERDYAIRQLSVFLDNRPGTLAKLTKHLADEGIDLRAISLAESRDFGTLRVIVADPDKAAAALSEGGFHFSEIDVLCVEVPDHPGGMAEVAEKLAQEHINIEYAYTMVVTRHDKALLVLRVDEIERAYAALKTQGRHVLTEEELRAL